VNKMTKKPSIKDLSFLEECKDQLFTGKNHLLKILRGNLRVPRVITESNEVLEKKDIDTLSFGQFISYRAIQKGKNMLGLSELLNIELSVLEEIYDDAVFPWELNPELIWSMCRALDVPIDFLRSLIDKQPMDPWLLKKRLPNSNSAARTHFTLDRKERENDLLKTDLIIQESREKDKKNIFLKLL
jgi:hypothetical protein